MSVKFLESCASCTHQSLCCSENSYCSLETRFPEVFQDFQNIAYYGTNHQVPCSYLAPNERPPRYVQEHLNTMNRGLIVSVGTERSFFDLLLSPPGKCTGVVVRDINPPVKAYIDFAKLLLLISKDREEFCRLATSPRDETELRARCEEISGKICQSNMPACVKNYYCKMLYNFAVNYYMTDKNWALSSDFEEVNYFKNDGLFLRLQNAVKSGAIIATIGDINELSFLQNEEIGVVDTSNVADYFYIDLKGFNPKYIAPLIIWTSTPSQFVPITYHSYQYQALTDEQRERFISLFNKMFSKEFKGDRASLTKINNDLLAAGCRNCEVVRCSYSYETLERMENYYNEYFYDFPGFDCVDLYARDTLLTQVPSHCLEKAVLDPNFVRKLVSLSLCCSMPKGDAFPRSNYRLFTKFYRLIDPELLKNIFIELIAKMPNDFKSCFYSNLTGNLDDVDLQYLVDLGILVI